MKENFKLSKMLNLSLKYWMKLELNIIIYMKKKVLFYRRKDKLFKKWTPKKCMVFKWVQLWRHFLVIPQWIFVTINRVEMQEHRRKIKSNKIKWKFLKIKDWFNHYKLPFSLQKNNWDQSWSEKSVFIKLPWN
jgi:hypothetical protein